MSVTPLEPARITLSRELKGWSQAELARQVDVSPGAISQFESGTTRPGSEVLAKIALALEVPPAFLGLTVVQTHEGFFRSLRRTSVSDRRKARALAYVAHDFATSQFAIDHLPTTDLPFLSLEDLNAPEEKLEEIAGDVRRHWHLPRGPVRSLVSLLEDKGVIVFRLPLESSDVDAFSLPFADRPVVVLCSDKDDRARSRFDAAHELGHLVMHGQTIWGLKEVEAQAHAFAAAFLMPKRDIERELPDRLDWPRFFDLKRKWQVSIAALVRRAKTLGHMSPSQYQAAMKEISARGWRRVEPVPLGAPESPNALRTLITAKGASLVTRQLPSWVIESFEWESP